MAAPPRSTVQRVTEAILAKASRPPPLSIKPTPSPPMDHIDQYAFHLLLPESRVLNARLFVITHRAASAIEHGPHTHRQPDPAPYILRPTAVRARCDISGSLVQVAEHKTGKTLRVQSPLAQADLAALMQAREPHVPLRPPCRSLREELLDARPVRRHLDFVGWGCLPATGTPCLGVMACATWGGPRESKRRAGWANAVGGEAGAALEPVDAAARPRRVRRRRLRVRAPPRPCQVVQCVPTL